MSSYKGQENLITSGYGPQGAAKDSNDILKNLELFSNKEFVEDKVTKINHYAELIKFQLGGGGGIL
jgi:hypothetical protein